jgi:hypothetical protein
MGLNLIDSTCAPLRFDPFSLPPYRFSWCLAGDGSYAAMTGCGEVYVHIAVSIHHIGFDGPFGKGIG